MKKNKIIKQVLRISLIIVLLVAGYFTYRYISGPVLFEKEKKIRYSATIEKLEDIRKAQEAYKDVHGKYTNKWETLIDFVMTDSFQIINSLGELTDSMLALGWNEDTAIVKGIIIRDTIHISVLDSLFEKSYPVDALKYIPVKDTLVEFLLAEKIISKPEGIMSSFEVRAHNNIILKGMNPKLINDFNNSIRANQQYPGLKVGSLEQPNNNTGNWE
jgi:hypothetical protein